MTTSDVHSHTAEELAADFRKGVLSPVEATETMLERIEAVDPALNAFCLVDGDRALEQATASERRFAAGKPLGPLDGVPVAVKDVFLTRGWPTLKGSHTVNPHQAWENDAPAVARLREAGAVFPGKTTTPEFGWKGVTDSPREGITRNPWDSTRTPGGSSGGSSAALATGMVPLALGTDGGGSIRIPGGFSGVVGIKPTFARVPHWPMSPFGTLAHAGPMARTVRDTARLLQVLSRADPRDWTALPPSDVDYVAGIEEGVVGLKIAFSLTLGYVDVDQEVAEAVTRAVETIERMGAHVEAADPPLGDRRRSFEVLWYSGAAALVARLDPEERLLIEPGLAEIAEEGATLSALDYLEATQQRIDLAVTMSTFLDRYDLLLTPTLPIPAFEAGREVPPGWPERRWHTWTPFSLPFNLSQQPAATVPCGLTSAGLPIGLQLVAAKHRDDLVLRAARAYETARTGGGGDQFTRPLAVVRGGEAPGPVP
ncbi:MAG: amidase [Actinomycetota bacterium]|nr:amidase [Actinomycetota bacterium]